MYQLAVMGSSNPSAVTQLRRVISASKARGLRVEVLVADLGPRSRPSPDHFADLGVPIRSLRAKPMLGGRFGYPSPASLVTFSSQLARELDEAPPQCVLTHVDSFGIYRILHWWAKSRGIPGIVMQEGMAAANKPGRGRKVLISHLHPLRRVELALCRHIRPNLLTSEQLYGYAERICVWGPAMQRQLKSLGRPAATITVTGSPAFDHHSRRRPLANPPEHAVLFAHQHQPNSVAEIGFCRELIDVCANKLKCRLLFRPHPRSRLTQGAVERVVAEVTENRRLVEVVTGGDVVDHLDRASVFVTFYSTAAYHALVHGVPLVLAEWISDTHKFDAARYGAALAVAESGELEPALRAALWDSSLRDQLYQRSASLIEDHLFRLDGRASERVADAVEQSLTVAASAPPSSA